MPPPDAIDVRGLQAVIPGIHPVQLLARDVQGQPVGPEDVGVDDRGGVASIHTGTHQGRTSTPVCPVHEPGWEWLIKKINCSKGNYVVQGPEKVLRESR